MSVRHLLSIAEMDLTPEAYGLSCEILVPP